jgi:hypothetical protein
MQHENFRTSRHTCTRFLKKEGLLGNTFPFEIPNQDKDLFSLIGVLQVHRSSGSWRASVSGQLEMLDKVGGAEHPVRILELRNTPARGYSRRRAFWATPSLLELPNQDKDLFSLIGVLQG